MKCTGIVRRIDDLGRVVIPKEIRRTFNICEGDPLEVYTSAEGITFKKYVFENQCIMCGEATDDLVGEKHLCNGCQSKIVRNFDSKKFSNREE